VVHCRPVAHENFSRALVDRWVEAGRGEQAAIREPKRVWTYSRLLDEAARAAAALTELGVHPGERVGTFMHDSAETTAILLGCARIGAVAVPINSLLRPHELRTIINHAGIVEIIAAGDLAGAIESVRGELPTLRHLCSVGGAYPGQIDFSALTRDVEPATTIWEPPTDSAPAFILYSGSPDQPVAYMHDHAAPGRAFALYAREVLGLTQSDRMVACAKLSTAFGLGLGLLFPLAAGAVTFVMPGRARPRALFDVLTAFQPTVIAMLPSLWAQLAHDYAELSPPRPQLMTSLRHAVSGGEMLPVAVENKVRELFKLELLHGFSVTAALSFVLSNRPGERRELSVGRPLPGVEARIVDDEGKALGPHEIGALELKAPTLAAPIRTGDRFSCDADGYFYFCGRDDDLMKVSGRWVAPAEVERALLQHPAVWDCVVVEDSDSDGLPHPHAYVVTNAGFDGKPALAVELQEFVKGAIAPYKYPRKVSFVEALPRAADGKVQRERLLRPAGR
jgi:benzoate-CoA ligase